MIGIKVHPGELLAEELTEIDVVPADLARQIGVPPNRISQIMAGKRGISADTALRLGRWFGTSPEFWLNLQNAYDLNLALEEKGDEIEALPTRAA
jgi:antitoxin HigA-1